MTSAGRGMRGSRPLWSALAASINGLCATYASVRVLLATGLAIAEPAVQAVVAACVLVGAIVGWLAATYRAAPLIVLVLGVLSFAVTLQAVMLMYPPAQRG